jgi:surfeit locus 1 family protein
MALRFRLRWIPFLAAVIVAALGFALGDWQTRRAQEKEAIEARLSQRESQPVLRLDGEVPPLEALEYRRVALRGQFVPGWNVFLDNRPYGGTAGFHVLAPFRLEQGATYVLVKRGWAPRDVTDRARVPAVPTPAGTVEIEGTVRRHVGKTMQLGAPDPLRPGAIVQNADVEEFASAGQWSMAPFVVEQLSDSGDGLVRDWPRPSSGADKHRGYAFQWYGLAAAALIFFFVTGFTRGSKPAGD